MGLYDYEDKVKELMKGKKNPTKEEINEALKKYILGEYSLGTYTKLYYWFYNYVRWIKERTCGGILNRHVFSHTQLREDITFINLRTYRPESKSYGFLTVAVNARSFWRRLRFYSKGNPRQMISESDGFSYLELLSLARDTEKRNEYIDRIELTILPIETSEIEILKNQVSSTVIKEIESTNAIDGAVCEVQDFDHYNKRMWCEIFTQFDSSGGYTNDIFNASNAKADIGSYKNPSDTAYYDPDNVKYVNYSSLY